MTTDQQPIDVVYTWVDDRFDGYLDGLNAHSTDQRDTNPNRTRDNIDVLKYSLRSLHTHLPRVNRIYLLTCRPQVPRWLDADHPQISVFHHDEVIAPEHLPTYNSFCIVSHLHLLPGLSKRFLYFEDDMLLLRPGLLEALAPSGQDRPLALFSHEPTIPLAQLDRDKASPWNLALANSDEALATRFQRRDRFHAIHGPLLIDRSSYAGMADLFADEFAATRQEKFRSSACIAPEYLYPHMMMEQGRATHGTRAQSKSVEGFASLVNFLPWTQAQLLWLSLRKPITATLNDSFEDRPNRRVERWVTAWLKNRFPDPSPWERG